MIESVFIQSDLLDFFLGYSTDPRKVLKNEWFKWKSF